MTDTVTTQPVDKPSDGDPVRRAGTRGQWRPLLVRMHFYAGVLVAPFIFLACLTGAIYVFNPQIDRYSEHHLIAASADGRTAVPLNDQVRTAISDTPSNYKVASVVPGDDDTTTRVNFVRPNAPEMTYYVVFVDPFTGDVRGSKDVTMHGGSMPFSAWMAQFHGDLGLGEFGRWYSETASLWIVVLTVGGLIVWWQRIAVHQKITSGRFWKKFLLVERGRRPGMKRTMSWHSTIGVWTALLALLFGLTGLPFARTSGPKWVGITGNMHRSSVTLDTTLPTAQSGTAGTGSHDMSGMGHDMSGTSGSNARSGGQRPSSGGSTSSGGMSMGGIPSATAAKADYDAMATAARGAGVDQQIRFKAPTRPTTGWTIEEHKSSWPVAYDSALVDPATSQVVRTLNWDQATPAVDKLNRYIMLFHFGRLFGFVGQVLFALTMLGVLWITWWGYKMWWQRRPRGSAWRLGKVPARGSWRKAPRVSLVIWSAATLVTFWFFPVLAVTAFGFLVLDILLGRIQATRRRAAATAGG